MELNRKIITDNVEEFMGIYNIAKPELKKTLALKIIHTRYVAANCLKIAETCNFSKEDIDIAWVIGELHDFARFGQLFVTKGYTDTSSYNHARMGVRLLFTHGLINDIIPNYDEISKENKDIIEKAILYHSEIDLPNGLTEREEKFCKLIRDADKIDIFRVIGSLKYDGDYGYTMEELLNSTISPEISNAIYEKRLADYRQRKTKADFLVTHIALVFGLEFKKSRETVKEQGYLSKMLSFEFYDKETNDEFKKIKKTVLDFLNE